MFNNMESIFIEKFEELFNVSFNNIVNIEDMGADSDDDGIYHYIDIALKNVYSFDTNEDMWLEKNLYQNDILQRLNIT